MNSILPEGLLEKITWLDDNDASQQQPVWSIAAATLVLATGTLYWSYTALYKYLWGSASTPQRPWRLVPGWIPILGHFHICQSLKHLPNVLEHTWADQYGKEHGCFDVDLAGTVYTVICRQDRSEEICRNRPKFVQRAPPVREGVASVGATGLFQAEGDVWTVEHKLVAASLNRKSIQDSYLPIFKDLANRLVSKWTDSCMVAKTRLDLAPEEDLTRISADSIGRVGLGRDFDFLHQPATTVGKDVRSVLMGAFSRCMMPIYYWRIPVIGQYLDGLGFAIARMRSLVNGVVTSHEEKRQSSSSKDASKSSQQQDDFLDKLYALMESEKVQLPPDRVAGNVMTLFLGGSDTTPKALTTALYILAKDQELQQQLQQEVAGFDLAKATVSDLLEKLPRLKSFLHEVHRYYANPVIFLRTQKDLPFCGTTLPKYSDVILLNRYLMTSKHSQVTEIPAGPDQVPVTDFCPTRYLVRDAVSGDVVCIGPTAGSYGAAGFGVGARYCPGRTYSEVLSLCVLVQLLQNINLAVVPNQREPKFIYDVLMVADYPVQLTMTMRVNGK